MKDSNFEKTNNDSVGKMYIKHRNTITRNGHKKELMISALQKYIRRCEFNKAVYCLLELDDFRLLRNKKFLDKYLESYDDRTGMSTLSLVKGLQTNIANRLRVISVEDIGIAQPGVCSTVNELLIKWEKSDRLDPNFLIEIVKLLCSSRKLRFISDLKSVYNLPPYYGGNNAENSKIKRFIEILRDYHDIKQPTGDENMHTDDITVFYWVSKNMEDITFKHEIWDIIKNRCIDEYKNEVDTLREWFKKGQPAKETPIYFYHALLLSISSNILKKTKPIEMLNINYPVETNAQYKLKNIDEYCNDKHVIGSGETSVMRFALEGAVCFNEAVEILNKDYRNLYIHLKVAIDEKSDLDEVQLIGIYPKIVEDDESNLESYYTFIVRAQPNTSSSKADAYFAEDPITGEFLFIKGPLKCIKDAENSINMNSWKKDNNLPYMNSLKIKMLIPDRWIDGVPLGIRNTIDRTKEAPFLISESTIDKDKIISNIITYGEYKVLKKDKTISKTWPLDLELVNWFNIHSHLQINSLNDAEFTDYVLNLLARWLFGISDLADRNFLRKNGHIYSIDEEYKDKNVSFWNELRKNKCKIIYDWINNNYEKFVFDRVNKWNLPEKYIEKHYKLLDNDFVLELFVEM